MDNIMKRNEINGTFLSADPSLKNTALVWGTIKGGVIEPLGHMISTTDKVKGEKVMIDMVNRARKTIENIIATINTVNPDFTFSEIPSGSQSLSGAKSAALSCAYIALLGTDCIISTPGEVKKATGNKRTATKEDMMDWADKQFPDYDFPRKKDGTMVKGKCEHICDALAVVEAGILKMVSKN
ncbi:MAG TPA: hypothetical protein DCW83_10505 [Saprospirales bacterium]|nr:hypothetical protein [Saprospirales bacterium]